MSSTFRPGEEIRPCGGGGGGSLGLFISMASAGLYGRRAGKEEEERPRDVTAWDAGAPRSLFVPRWRRRQRPLRGEVGGGESGWARAEERKYTARKHHPVGELPHHSLPKPWPPWWPSAKAPSSSAKPPSGETQPSWIIAGRPSPRSREPPPASSASTASTASSSTSWPPSYSRCFWC